MPLGDQNEFEKKTILWIVCTILTTYNCIEPTNYNYLNIDNFDSR